MRHDSNRQSSHPRRVNWLTGVRDEFAEKARTAPLGLAGAVTLTAGLLIFLVGDLAAL
ncbi:hypothetical protein [Nocardia yunnanensis]|uniref:hypothetical protein n=1 Tax=Nocardia yunnanensis TaxID=2382165 RepID=UPI0013C40FF1|nr:hypothetical protein [Nocardia yunnanensis]